jgi:ribosomal protein L31
MQSKSLDVNCSTCGNQFVITSTLAEEKYQVENCHLCHTAYTHKKTKHENSSTKNFYKKYQDFSDVL